MNQTPISITLDETTARSLMSGLLSADACLTIARGLYETLPTVSASEVDLDAALDAVGDIRERIDAAIAQSWLT